MPRNPSSQRRQLPIIRRVRPDVLLSVDPGEWYERSHEPIIGWPPLTPLTLFRAAELWLYFPNQRLQQGLQTVRKLRKCTSSTPRRKKQTISSTLKALLSFKFESATKQVSQFEPAVNKYRPDWTAEDLKKAKDEMRKEQPKKDGHYVEAFRHVTEFNQY